MFTELKRITKNPSDWHTVFCTSLLLTLHKSHGRNAQVLERGGLAHKPSGTRSWTLRKCRGLSALEHTRSRNSHPTSTTPMTSL